MKGSDYQIVYYDNLLQPIFRQYFADEAEWHGLYRNYASQLLVEAERGFGLPVQYPVMYTDVPGDNCRLLIVFDTMITDDYLKWLREKKRGTRIILWMWNPVRDPKKLERLRRYAEIWSYSPKDCRTYGLQYNTPFYFDSLIREAENSPKSPRNQLYFFIGRRKGRTVGVEQMKDLLEKEGAHCKILFPLNHFVIPYKRYLRFLKESEGILDYYNDPLSGLSMRTMESIYWKKKLVSNNTTLPDYDFYDENNVYIPRLSQMPLKEFLRLPYRAPEKKILDKYRLSSWLSRFETNEQNRAGCSDVI